MSAGVYDAATMRPRSQSSAALLGTIAVLLGPLAAGAQQSQRTPASAPITLTLTPIVGAEAVALAGNAPPSQRLEAALYARFSRDLPTVLLSRTPLMSDAAGHYATTMPTASAFFRGAIVTAVVRIPATTAFAQASTELAAPNAPAPPDTIPASVR